MTKIERLRADRDSIIARLALCQPNSRNHTVLTERLRRVTLDLMQAEIRGQK
ncbi:hypothetical protein PE067_09250 [Paracoccus sp. DMF-8]|uniref:hypothetical protein n=1 Tax=Paracoccus sp. DMF-8 TaxID=3019445 RepID=UPI0023E7B3D2|nr:hypothetical protein [Paracoccus sp. DMF-8]MDF3606304.1 hypothetical protein [Paracoccus sp. DMF-8]